MMNLHFPKANQQEEWASDQTSTGMGKTQWTYGTWCYMQTTLESNDTATSSSSEDKVRSKSCSVRLNRSQCPLPSGWYCISLYETSGCHTIDTTVGTTRLQSCGLDQYEYGGNPIGIKPLFRKNPSHSSRFLVSWVNLEKTSATTKRFSLPSLDLSNTVKPIATICNGLEAR